MRTLAASLLLVPLASSCIVGGKHAVNVYGGYRSYDGDFAGASEPLAFGLEGMVGLNAEGLSVEGGYAYAEDSGGGVELETNELYAGLRKTWNSDGLVQPFVGGGVDWLEGDANGVTDSGYGLYGRAGVGFQITLFQAGVDLRGVWSDAGIGGQDLSFVQPAIFIGLSF